jgi:hypothetical protein
MNAGHRRLRADSKAAAEVGSPTEGAALRISMKVPGTIRAGAKRLGKVQIEGLLAEFVYTRGRVATAPQNREETRGRQA